MTETNRTFETTSKRLCRVATAGIQSFPTDHQQAGRELALGKVVGRISPVSARIEADQAARSASQACGRFADRHIHIHLHLEQGDNLDWRPCEFAPTLGEVAVPEVQPRKS